MESTLNDNGGDLSFSEDFRKRVTTNLENHPTVTHDGHDLRKAAVAIAITPLENGQSGFILTRRGKNLKTHSYQYALPGGKIDEGETQEETVLREVQEEVGIQANKEKIVVVDVNESKKLIKLFINELEGLNWNDNNINNCLKEFVKKQEIKFPEIAMPLRCIIAGTDNTPSIGSIIYILGIDIIKRRVSVFV